MRAFRQSWDGSWRTQMCPQADMISEKSRRPDHAPKPATRAMRRTWTQCQVWWICVALEPFSLPLCRSPSPPISPTHAPDLWGSRFSQSPRPSPLQPGLYTGCLPPGHAQADLTMVLVCLCVGVPSVYGFLFVPPPPSPKPCATLWPCDTQSSSVGDSPKNRMALGSAEGEARNPPNEAIRGFFFSFTGESQLLFNAPSAVLCWW